MFSRALAVAAITTVAALAADNSRGTWKLNVATCKYPPAPFPVKSLPSVREAAPGGVKVTTTGERTDGTAVNASYTATYDGSAATVTGSGAPYDTISVKQVNANTFTYEAKQANGKYQATGRTVISRDGKTMTTTAKGTDAHGLRQAVAVSGRRQVRGNWESRSAATVRKFFLVSRVPPAFVIATGPLAAPVGTIVLMK
jgi:hypothetical protein